MNGSDCLIKASLVIHECWEEEHFSGNEAGDSRDTCLDGMQIL